MDYRTFRARFGAALKRRRKLLELTQAQLADRVQKDQANITRIERGKQGFDSETLFDLARELKTSLADLFAEVEQTSTDALPKEAIAVARMWQRLPRPTREAYRSRIEALSKAYARRIPGDEVGEEPVVPKFLHRDH
jgi:transcriptional regulator with XRE-family HTH domain